MQACGSVCFTATLPLKSSKALSLPRSTPSSSKPRTKRPSLALTKAAAGSPADAAAVENVIDYSSSASVFPAEACETIGGEACNVTVFPETRLEASTNSADSNIAVEEIDREYLDYNQLKTAKPDYEKKQLHIVRKIHHNRQDLHTRFSLAKHVMTLEESSVLLSTRLEFARIKP